MRRRSLALSAVMGLCACVESEPDGGPVGETSVIASGQNKPSALAVDAENVYWLNAATIGGVFKRAKAGGPVTAIFEGPLEIQNALGIDDASIYFVSNGAIVAVPKAGGALRTIAASGGSMSGAAAAGGNVYWIEAPDGPMGPAHVKRAPTAGGMPTEVPVTNGPSGAAVAVSTSADGVYATFVRGGFLRVPIDGTGPRYTPSTRFPSFAAAADTTHVYVTEGDSLSKADKTGAAPIPFKGALTATSVAVDDTFVFFTETAPAGRVLRVRKSDGAMTALAEQQGAPRGVVTDGSGVYWACIDEGTIKKIAK
jgi:hypothetical protein